MVSDYYKAYRLEHDRVKRLRKQINGQARCLAAADRLIRSVTGLCGSLHDQYQVEKAKHEGKA